VAADEAPEPEIPRIPRGKGFKLSMGELVKIAMLATLLVAILVLQKPCADSVAKLVTSFGSDTGSGSGSQKIVDTPEGTYVRITPDMTPEQIKAAIEQARGHGSGSAGSATPPPTGSAAPAGSGSATR